MLDSRRTREVRQQRFDVLALEASPPLLPLPRPLVFDLDHQSCSHFFLSINRSHDAVDLCEESAASAGHGWPTTSESRPAEHRRPGFPAKNKGAETTLTVGKLKSVLGTTKRLPLHAFSILLASVAIRGRAQDAARCFGKHRLCATIARRAVADPKRTKNGSAAHLANQPQCCPFTKLTTLGSAVEVESQDTHSTYTKCIICRSWSPQPRR